VVTPARQVFALGRLSGREGDPRQVDQDVVAGDAAAECAVLAGSRKECV
jgi:hypothetical protein